MLLKDYYNSQARLQKRGVVVYDCNLFENEYNDLFGDYTLENAIKGLQKLKTTGNTKSKIKKILWAMDTPCRAVLWRLIY